MKARSNTDESSIVQRLQSILGPCVLLACKGKRPTRKAWQKLTLEDMSPAYLDTLNAGNIGVSLGAPSQGLVSIDFDTDESLASFVQRNPALDATLRTRGQRGGNLWLRIVGELPPSRKLVDQAGQPAGEWRSTGNQTIIHGIHPGTRRPYETIVQQPPVEIEASRIQWCPEAHPLDWQYQLRPGSCDREDKGDKETQRDTGIENDSAMGLCSSASLYHTNNISSAIAALDAQKDFERVKGAGVVRLYDRLVDRRFTAIKHGRNDFITKAVPFHYRALSVSRAMEFSMQFYLRHQAIFRDPADQHESETRAMLEAASRTYHKELSEDERNLY